MTRRFLFMAAVLLTVLAVFQVPADAQCALCRRALEASPEGKVLAGSFRHGILLLMFAPYMIFGASGYAIFRAYKKKARNTE